MKESSKSSFLRLSPSPELVDAVDTFYLYWCPDVTLMSWWYCDGTVIVLWWYCDGVVMVLWWYCDGVVMVSVWGLSRGVWSHYCSSGQAGTALVSLSLSLSGNKTVPCPHYTLTVPPSGLSSHQPPSIKYQELQQIITNISIFHKTGKLNPDLQVRWRAEVWWGSLAGQSLMSCSCSWFQGRIKKIDTERKISKPLGLFKQTQLWQKNIWETQCLPFPPPPPWPRFKNKIKLFKMSLFTSRIIIDIFFLGPISNICY